MGKSSLFNLLTQQAVAAENYPFCTIEPTEARCPVPDKRYDWLCELWKPPSCISAFLMVTDIAGLIKGASTGAGLGNAFLSNIGACDGIYHVVRAFENDEVLHVDDSVDPVRDLEVIHGELIAKDLQYVIAAIEKEAEQVKKKRSQSYKTPEAFTTAFDKAKAYLEDLQPLRDQEFTTDEVEQINLNCTNQLLTTKPIVYVVNISEKSITTNKNKFLPKIQEWVKEHGGGMIIPFSIEFEEQVWGLKDAPDARADYIKGKEPCMRLNKIIKQGFKQLNLMNFFTVGDDEVRSWTVYAGATAPNAAGVIHTCVYHIALAIAISSPFRLLQRKAALQGFDIICSLASCWSACFVSS